MDEQIQIRASIEDNMINYSDVLKVLDLFMTNDENDFRFRADCQTTKYILSLIIDGLQKGVNIGKEEG